MAALAVLACALAMPLSQTEDGQVEFNTEPGLNTTGLTAQAPAASCSCSGSDLSSIKQCSSMGDPHFRSFSGKYDFMGLGVYQLVKATTKCGCQIEVQTFMGARPDKAGASSNLAVAVKIGSSTRVIMPNDVNGDPPKPSGDISIRKTKEAIKKGPAWCWVVAFPGGGDLKVCKVNKGSMCGYSGLYSVFVNLPTNYNAQGLCQQRCTGVPPLPNTQCGTSACLPVYTQDSIFSSTHLNQLENNCRLDKTTRPSKVLCGNKPDTSFCDGGGCTNMITWNPPPPPQGGGGGGQCNNVWHQYMNCGTKDNAVTDEDHSKAYSKEVCMKWCEGLGKTGCCKVNIGQECKFSEGDMSFKQSNGKASRYASIIKPCGPAPDPPMPNPNDPNRPSACPKPENNNWFYAPNGAMSVWKLPAWRDEPDACNQWCMGLVSDKCTEVTTLTKHYNFFDHGAQGKPSTCCKIKTAILAGQTMRCGFVRKTKGTNNGRCHRARRKISPSSSPGSAPLLRNGRPSLLTSRAGAWRLSAKGSRWPITSSEASSKRPRRRNSASSTPTRSSRAPRARRLCVKPTT